MQIYIWQLRDGDLQGIAFIDTQIYIHQMSVVKNLILVADVARSISLMRYQEEMKVLSLVSRVSRSNLSLVGRVSQSNLSLVSRVSQPNLSLVGRVSQPNLSFSLAR